MARSKLPSDAAVEELRAFGLGYPGAHTKSPWPGHLDLAVNDKTFAYLSLAGEPLHISCKLPHSNDEALGLPFTKPAEYGLGKSGWVTADFSENEVIPVELLKQWIDESYRAQAPKRLMKGLARLSLGASSDLTDVQGGMPDDEAPRATPAARRRPKKKASKKVTSTQRSAKKVGAKKRGVAKAGVKKRGAKKRGAKKRSVKKRGRT